MFTIGYTLAISNSSLLIGGHCLNIYNLYVTYTKELNGNIEYPNLFKRLICNLTNI